MNIHSPRSFFGSFHIAALSLLFVFGTLIRLYDLTDLPLDFHPTRQLFSALKARGMYYQSLPDAPEEQRQFAIQQGKMRPTIEPEILEKLTVFTWKFTGERLWVARIYSSIFWLIVGIFLYLLARDLFSRDGALFATAFYLLLPYGVFASRSFQPDPLMTASAFIGIYFLYRWSESLSPNSHLATPTSQSWKFAILASAFIGFAVFVKIFIGFIAGGAAVAIVLFTLKGKFWRSPQVWTMAAIMGIPAFLFYFTGDRGNSTEYITNWSLGMLKLITSTDFYSRWLSFLGSLFGLTILFLSLAGTLLAAPRGRALLIGLWTGYLLYGLSVPFQMYTHSYYHIQLTPIIALGLSPLIETVTSRIGREKRVWQAALVALTVAVVGYHSWVARSVLIAEDFRAEPAYWQTVGEAIPANADVIALAQDYGYRLMYYGWRRVDLWPLASGLAEVRGNTINTEKTFAEMAAGKDYFLVTSFNQLDKQPDLKKILDGYPIAAQGDGYVLYDLRK